MRAEDQATRPRSITHLCVPTDVGGLETVVVGLSRALAEHGHRVTLVAVVRTTSAAAPVFDPLHGSPVTTIAVEVPSRAYHREIRGVRGILAAQRPDVLHTHGYRADLLHGEWARRRGIATVSTLHGSSKMGGLSQLFERLQVRSMRRFDGVIAVSRPIVDALAARGVPRERIHYIQNAWSPPTAPLERREARRLLGLPDDDTLVLGWVGRLFPVKGADVFVRSLAGLSEPSHLACIVGDGPERPALEALADGLGVADRIRWAGAVPEAGRLFSAFDALVLSSRSEGTPMVLLEAMGHGVPVVATGVGGVPDVIDGAAEGWLVPSEAPERLAEALRAVLSDRHEAATRARRARARIDRELDSASWVRRHERAYEAAIAQRRRP